jgi:tRNA A37 methylthiotransferase MiaB
VTLLGQNVNAWRGTIDGAPADFAELLYFVSEIPASSGSATRLRIRASSRSA